MSTRLWNLVILFTRRPWCLFVYKGISPVYNKCALELGSDSLTTWQHSFNFPNNYRTFCSTHHCARAFERFSFTKGLRNRSLNNLKTKSPGKELSSVCMQVQKFSVSIEAKPTLAIHISSVYQYGFCCYRNKDRDRERFLLCSSFVS